MSNNVLKKRKKVKLVYLLNYRPAIKQTSDDPPIQNRSFIDSLASFRSAGVGEVLTSLHERYEVGKVKQKMVKMMELEAPYIAGVFNFNFLQLHA